MFFFFAFFVGIPRRKRTTDLNEPLSIRFSGVGCGCCGLRARSTGDVKAQDECNGTVSAEEASAGEKNGGESLNTRWRVLREESYVASGTLQLILHFY